MNKRIAKKKITNNISCKLWLRCFIDNAKSFTNFIELLDDENLNTDTQILYNNSIDITLHFMEFDLQNAHKSLSKYNISKRLFIKSVYELLQKYRIQIC